MENKLFTVDERVRWSAVDQAGIIFYGAYVRFFELAEMELFREAGVPYGEAFDRFGIWLPRAHLESDFYYPSRLDDNLRVAASQDTLRPRPMPEELRKVLSPYLMSVEQARAKLHSLE